MSQMQMSLTTYHNMNDYNFNPNSYTSDSADASQDAFFADMVQNPPRHSTWTPSDAHQRLDSRQLGDNRDFFPLPHARTQLPQESFNGHPNTEQPVDQMPALAGHGTVPLDPVLHATRSPVRSSTPEDNSPSPSRSASPISPEHRASYSGKEYIGLATLVVDLNPFAAKHGHKGAAWEKVASAAKAKGLFKLSSTETIKNKALALIKYQEVCPDFTLAVPHHLLYLVGSRVCCGNKASSGAELNHWH